MNRNDPSDNASLITAMEGKCLEMSDNPVQTIIAGSALGETGKKSAGDAKREVAQATGGLPSLDNVFPILTPFFCFFLHCGTWSQAN